MEFHHSMSIVGNIILKEEAELECDKTFLTIKTSKWGVIIEERALSNITSFGYLMVWILSVPPLTEHDGPFFQVPSTHFLDTKGFLVINTRKRVLFPGLPT